MSTSENSKNNANRTQYAIFLSYNVHERNINRNVAIFCFVISFFFLTTTQTIMIILDDKQHSLLSWQLLTNTFQKITTNRLFIPVTADHKPEERLPITGANFEEQLESFVKFMRDEIGFELLSWARAPYLCEGDFAQAYYWLDDSVYVFTPIESTTQKRIFDLLTSNLHMKCVWRVVVQLLYNYIVQ